MAKTKSKRRKGGAKQTGSWSNADHDARTAKRIASLNKNRRRRIQSAEEDSAREESPHRQSPTEPFNIGSKRQSPQHHDPPLHQIRLKKKPRGGNRHRLASQVPDDAYKRSHLAHDNYDQIDSSKLRLATAQVQRKIDALRERLENWDPVEEASLAAAARAGDDKSSIERKMELDACNRLQDRHARQKAEGERDLLHAQHGVNSSKHRRKANLKKKPRPGPELWKLRGAARPAWEVYDFDTRYVDMHARAREDANERARRVRNVLSLCRGHFAETDAAEDDDGRCNKDNNKSNQNSLFPPPQPHCRKYLSLLTQHGSLQLHRKNYSSARKSFLEAIELEGPLHRHSVTNARNQLMNIYLSTNRPSSARRLWTSLENDPSAWIRYSAALIEYVSWSLLGEEGSTAGSAERALVRAIRANVYIAYLLGWPATFERAMEYTDEVVEGGMMDAKGGSLLEAIEYGCCCYSSQREEEDEERGISMWLGTEGSLDWMRSVVLRALNMPEEEDGGKAENSKENEGNVEKGPDDWPLTRADLLSWETKLTVEEEEHERKRKEKEQKMRHQEEEKDGRGEDNDEEEELDVVMYGGMFRTAMDWLQDAGEFLREPSY